MSYRFESRIRYSEIGENGCLTLPGILDYFQDCCTFHSESIGQGMDTREFDSLGSPNASQSLIRLYFFCQFLILYFHVMPSYVIITMR